MRRLRFVLAVTAILALGLFLSKALRERPPASPRPPAAPAPENARAAAPAPARPAPAGLHGFVLDAHGIPVEGANVAALPPGVARRSCWDPSLGGAMTRTGAAGRFEFADVAAGAQLIAWRGIDGLAVAPAEPPGPCVLRFRAGVWIEGFATDERGLPVAEVEVTPRARPRDGPVLALASPAVARTDAVGAFRLGPVAPGATVVLEARSLTHRPHLSSPVEVPDQGVAQVRLTLVAGLGVTGVVRSSDGPPLAGATIEAHQADGQTFRARSGPDGAFSLGGLTAGSLRLYAGGAGHAPALSEAAVPSDRITITLAPETRVSGRVVPALPGLHAVATSDGLRYRTAVRPDGRFQIDGVGRGPVVLEIETSDMKSVASATLDLRTQRGEVVVRIP